MEQVVLVNDKDESIGEMEKMQAHVEGRLHRAFSVFLFNQHGEMLMHQRAMSKYHSPGLWTNACCSHPRPNEEVKDAAMRRLMEELNFQTAIEKRFDFTYHATFENGLIEHEFDHVFFGICDAIPNFNPNEVAAMRWLELEALDTEIKTNPNSFTPWFRIAWPLVIDSIKNNRL
jgi:isopentenyl-diphosphate Delta-isomerase